MKNNILLILTTVFISISFICSAQDAEKAYAFGNYHKYYNEARKTRHAEKEKSIEEYRQYYSKIPYSHHTSPVTITGKECLDLLDNEGRFIDFRDKESEVIDNNYTQSANSKQQEQVANIIFDAYNRIWKIADDYRKGELTISEAFTDKYCKAILYYGNMEISRINIPGRFHISCFGAPTAAANTYLFFLKEMDDAESGQCTDKLKTDACDMLKVIALQGWTQPLRRDATDDDVVQIERFRKHVWWVGGNALGYRPLFLSALMYKSIPMIDLIAEVSQRSISNVSQNTYEQAFWDEGFTADGAGWGHGKQCLIWGYPIDGTGNALKLLSVLDKSPWEKKLSAENTSALLNFFRGGNWYHYKGYILPCLDRYSAAYYDGKSHTIPYLGMLNNVIDNWADSFTPQQYEELLQLKQEAQAKNINMDGYSQGMYSGTRWFFNNDDLIKKNDKYHITINMASVRCDGLESAVEFADSYNFFTSDGLTLFQRKGDEYRQIIGAWDVTAYPGVTAREGMDKITPVTNWRGYCSKYNFVGAATYGGENAVAGFIFEKGNGENKDDSNHNNEFYLKNPTIYDVQAYKSYFIIGDYMVALGEGITNLKPEFEGTIRTTIDQTVHSDDIYVTKNGKRELNTSGIHSFFDNGKAVWVSQKNGFSYTVLPEFTNNAYFVAETKANEWNKRNKTNESKANLPEQADILRLWVDHGQNAENSTYGYVVYCGDNFPKNDLPFRVLQNDTHIQAIKTVDKKIIEAVFYDNHESLLAKGTSLKVSAPAVILIEDKGNEYIISANDPQMNPDLKQLHVSFNKKDIIIDMPQGELGGKPAIVRLKK